MSDWSAADLDQLKRLVAEGLSAGQIAVQMPGRSRNAIIGKIMRAEGRLGHLAGSVRPKKERAPTSEARSVRKARLRPQITPAPKLAPTSLPPEPPKNLPAPMPISFWEAVERGRCLHFVGNPFGPGGPDMPVCGAERAQDARHDNRYCRRHLMGQAAASSGEVAA